MRSAAARVDEMQESNGEAGVPSLRSLAPTLPAPPSAAPREKAPSPKAEAPAAPPFEMPRVRRRRPKRRVDWCVDHGASITTLSTFELWMAVASGEVHAGTRVWREGMECWARLEYIPEIACALRDVPQCAAPVVETAGEDRGSHDELLTEPAPAPEVDLGVDDALAEILTEPRSVSPAPVLDETPAPVVALRPREAWSPRWLASGIAAAVVAVAAASFAGGQKHAANSHAARRAGPFFAVATATLAGSPEAPTGGSADPDEASDERPPFVDRPVEPKRDPGQQRRRRGTVLPRR